MPYSMGQLYIFSSCVYTGATGLRLKGTNPQIQ